MHTQRTQTRLPFIDKLDVLIVRDIDCEVLLGIESKIDRKIIIRAD